MLTVSDVADMGSYWPRRVAQEQEGAAVNCQLADIQSAQAEEMCCSCLLCVEGLTEQRVDSGHTLLDTPLSRGVLVHDHCTQLCHTHAAKSYQRPRATGVNVRMWRQSINMCQPPAAKHSTNTAHLSLAQHSSHKFEECTVLQRMLGQGRQRDRAARVARMGVERHQAYTHVRTVTHHLKGLAQHLQPSAPVVVVHCQRCRISHPLIYQVLCIQCAFACGCFVDDLSTEHYVHFLHCLWV
jgi:hypothetical protein